MKATNTTTMSRQVKNYTVELTLSEHSARALVRARRDLKKSTLRRNLSAADADVINGLPMIIGSILEDAGRDTREVDFDSRTYND